MGDCLLRATAGDQEEWKRKMAQKTKPALAPSLPRGFTKKDIDGRWQTILKSHKIREQTGPHGPAGIKETLLDPKTYEESDLYKNNIENFIGTVKVPLGVTGPIRVNGLYSKGDYYVPMATTEAALIASYNRGMRVLSESGGVSVAVVDEGISRDPCAVFHTLAEVTQFVKWAKTQYEEFKRVAESTTNHGKLKDIKYTLLANYVHMKFIYTTGDASGQNMVTIATDAVCKYILKNTPIQPVNLYVEGGMSSDKKASAQHLLSVRGKKVIAECIIPKKVIENVLHVTVQQFADFQTMGSAVGYMIGYLGNTLHYSNAITAMGIALGQDPACASECHIGITSGHVTAEGDAYVSVTLPNLLVASIGGGTKLPSQRACLELMGLYGADKSCELAEIVAAVCLAGELSLTAAILSNDFAKAHQLMARGDQVMTTETSLEELFERAQVEVMKLSNMPNRDILMKIYGLYKQATVGDVNVPKPSTFSTDFVGKAKYKAWADRKGMKKEEAMKQYVDLVKQLSPTFTIEKASEVKVRSASVMQNANANSEALLNNAFDAQTSSPAPSTSTSANNNETSTTTSEPQQEEGPATVTEIPATTQEQPTEEDSTSTEIEAAPVTSDPSTPSDASTAAEVEQLRNQLRLMKLENERMRQKINELKAPYEAMTRIFNSDE